MKKFLRFTCPLITFMSEFILLFIEKDTLVFYILLGIFSFMLFVSAYLWRKELF